MQRVTISAKQWLIPPLAVIHAAVFAAFLAGVGVPQKQAFTEWNELWKRELEANPKGRADVYEAGGREYVVFCAAGRRPESAPADAFAWKAGKPAAQGYYAFALPETSGK